MNPTSEIIFIFLAKMRLSIFHVKYIFCTSCCPQQKKNILMFQQTNQPRNRKQSPQLPWTSVLMHFGWAASTATRVRFVYRFPSCQRWWRVRGNSKNVYIVVCIYIYIKVNSIIEAINETLKFWNKMIIIYNNNNGNDDNDNNAHQWYNYHFQWN